jgi:hypothetical protein
MDSLQADHACQLSVISWLQVTLECACKLGFLALIEAKRYCHFSLAFSCVKFMLNKQSPALSLSVDHPMLFSIESLQECSQLVESLEDGTAFAGKALERCLHTLSHLLQLVFLSIAVYFIPNKQSPALLLSVDCPTLLSIEGLQECS